MNRINSWMVHSLSSRSSCSVSSSRSTGWICAGLPNISNPDSACSRSGPASTPRYDILSSLSELIGLGLSLRANMQEGGEWAWRTPVCSGSAPDRPERHEMNWNSCDCCCSSNFKMSLTEKGVLEDVITGLGSMMSTGRKKKYLRVQIESSVHKDVCFSSSSFKTRRSVETSLSFGCTSMTAGRGGKEVEGASILFGWLNV